jgi:hypothetical protein
MSSRDRTGKSPRRCVVSLEGLEQRRLLSYYGGLLHASTAEVRPVSASQVGGDTSDLGPPSPHEAARQRFAARLVGSFVTAPGRYQKQPLQGLLLTTGSSNQSLHLQSQMQFFTYSDPTLPPNGQINMATRNNSTSGSQLVLNLTADPTSLVHGLPSHFTWTVDASSGGVWQNATGQGTLDVVYRVKGQTRGFLDGGASVVVQGQIISNHGLTLNLSLPNNRTHNQTTAHVP